MQRRHFITLVGGMAAAWPLVLYAQPLGRMARIGFSGSASATGSAKSVEALRAGLRDLGYVEGRNIVLEFQWAEGKYDRLSELVAELIRLNVDVIVTHGTPGTRTAKNRDLCDSYCHGDQRRRHRDGSCHESRAARSKRHGIDFLYSATQCKTARIGQGSLSACCSRGGAFKSEQSREQTDHSSNAGRGHAVEVGI